MDDIMECCGTCMYYKMGLKDWICSCRESEYYIEHPEPNHYCEEWEEAEDTVEIEEVLYDR